MNTTDLILDASLRLMNKYGYGSLSLTQIADEIGITKQRVYYHFKAVDEILMILAQEWSKTGQAYAIESLAKTHEVGVFKLIAMSNGMFDWMNEKSELSKLGLVIFQTSPYIKELDQFMTEAKNAGRDRIQSILIQEKTFSKMNKKKIDHVVTTFHSLMYGFYFYIIAMNDFSNLNSHRENCNQSIRRLIDSY